MAALCLPPDHVFCDCRLSAIVQATIVRGLSATLTLPDYGRVARNPSTIDAKRGDHSLQADLPGLNAPGVRFVIASFPLTDGARPSRDVRTIIARSVYGRIQNYSRGGHHDPNQCYTTRQRAGRCNSSV